MIWRAWIDLGGKGLRWRKEKFMYFFEENMYFFP